MKTVRNHGFHLRAWRWMSLVCCWNMLIWYTNISERQESLECDAVWFGKYRVYIICLFPEEYGFCHGITPRMQVFFGGCDKGALLRDTIKWTRCIHEHLLESCCPRLHRHQREPVTSQMSPAPYSRSCHLNPTSAFWITSSLYSINHDSFKSRDSSVGIVTRLRTGRSGVRIPAGKRAFLFKRSISALRLTQPTIEWIPRHFPVE